MTPPGIEVGVASPARVGPKADVAVAGIPLPAVCVGALDAYVATRLGISLNGAQEDRKIANTRTGREYIFTRSILFLTFSDPPLIRAPQVSCRIQCSRLNNN